MGEQALGDGATGCDMLASMPATARSRIEKYQSCRNTGALSPTAPASADKPGCPRSAGRRARSLASSSGPSRSTKRARLRQQHGRRHRQRGRHHAAGHDGEAEPLGFRGHRQRLGQAAGLVELDVDRVVFAGERRQRSAVMHAFVGADRDRPLDARPAPRRAPSGSGCSTSTTPACAQAARLAARLSLVPAFIGVDDQRRAAARRRAPRRCARDRRRPPSLILSSARLARLGGGLRPSRRARRARSYRRW